LGKVYKGEITSIKEFWSEVEKITEEQLARIEEEGEKMKGKDYTGAPLPALDDESADEMIEALEDFGKDVLEEQQDYQDAFTAAEEEFGRDIEEIKQDYYDEWYEIAKEYWDTIKKIDEKEREDILDAREELAKDIADANKDFNEKIAEENEKYREKEIKAQKDYQEALRRLREEFLFDLEDALRKRDASQVMRLIRRYNLDKAQFR